MGRRRELLERVGMALNRLTKIERDGRTIGLRWLPFKRGTQQSNLVRVDVDGDAGEETRPGRNVWGGVVSRNRASNRRRKKTKIKLVVALDGSGRVKNMQQPTKNTRARRGRDIIRSATVGERRGGVHLIVLGRTS